MAILTWLFEIWESVKLLKRKIKCLLNKIYLFFQIKKSVGITQ